MECVLHLLNYNVICKQYLNKRNYLLNCLQKLSSHLAMKGNLKRWSHNYYDPRKCNRFYFLVHKWNTVFLLEILLSYLSDF
jgi:hypothetical protein